MPLDDQLATANPQTFKQTCPTSPFTVSGWIPTGWGDGQAKQAGVMILGAATLVLATLIRSMI